MISAAQLRSPHHGFYPALEGSDQRWYTSGGKVDVREKSAFGISNLIGFVSAAKVVNKELAALEPTRVKWVAVPMLHQASKVQQAFEKHNFLVKLILKVVVFFCTGTTLHGQVASLKQASGRIEDYKEKLIEDAEEILNAENGLEAYKLAAAQYPIPERKRNLPLIDHRRPINGILHHLAQAVAVEGRSLITLLNQGKTWEDAEVLQLGTSCMQLAGLAYLLTMKYEVACLAEANDSVKNRAKYMNNQSVFPWLIVEMFDALYIFLRGGAVRDDKGEWKYSAFENKDVSQQFFADDTEQGRWRKQYNEIIAQLDQEIGINEIKKSDTRFLSGLDDQEAFSPESILEAKSALLSATIALSRAREKNEPDVSSLVQECTQAEEKWNKLYRACSVPQKRLLGEEPKERLKRFISPI